MLTMGLSQTLENLRHVGPVFRDAIQCGNPEVLASLMGPAYRGFVQQVAKRDGESSFRVGFDAHFDWQYERSDAGAMKNMRRLYEAAKRDQWNGSMDLDWETEIDPGPYGRALVHDHLLPILDLAEFKALPEDRQIDQRLGLLSWMLSQFLHGEQGALVAAAQVTEAVPWLDAKLYGSTQVVDEGRHVEVFHTYLTQKLGKLYEINDNLYVVIDALMLAEDWDIKFLGMQIMIEGLALGAFGTMRHATDEPLLRELLKRVITDEARHVHFGVIALGEHWRQGMTERERRYREDWALEVSIQLRNRFLAHEFYAEYYGHKMSRAAWDKMVLGSPLMEHFRKQMFRRIMPNLRRLGLMSPRVERHYANLGLLDLSYGKAAPDLSAEEMLEDEAA